jgi:hypothetical protein
MNFAAARQLIGQKDEKGWDKKVSMLATFGEGTGQISFNQNQKQENKCKLTDDMGETHNVILRGNTLPDAQWLGRRGSFLVSAYQGNYQGKPYVGYSGFWNNNAQVDQQPTSQPPANEPYHVPVGQPQNPPLSPQSPIAPQGGRDATGVSIERQACFKATCEIASRRSDLFPDKASIFDFLHHGHGWVATGTVDPTAMASLMPTGPANFDPNQDDSDLPPELRADYQG